MESIAIPSTVDIEHYVFQGCDDLREVAMNGINEKIGKDAFYDCRPLERLTFPRISTRLGIIIQTGHYSMVENKIDEVRGVVERRGSELFVPAAAMDSTAMDAGLNWNTIKQRLHQIIKLIGYYEVKEATTLFGLALWKAQIDQVDDINPMNREACRIDVPGPVKDIILQYLYNGNELT